MSIRRGFDRPVELDALGPNAGAGEARQCRCHFVTRVRYAAARHAALPNGWVGEPVRHPYPGSSHRRGNDPFTWTDTGVDYPRNGVGYVPCIFRCAAALDWRDGVSALPLRAWRLDGALRGLCFYRCLYLVGR